MASVDNILGYRVYRSTCRITVQRYKPLVNKGRCGLNQVVVNLWIENTDFWSSVGFMGLLIEKRATKWMSDDWRIIGRLTDHWSHEIKSTPVCQV